MEKRRVWNKFNIIRLLRRFGLCLLVVVVLLCVPIKKETFALKIADTNAMVFFYAKYVPHELAGNNIIDTGGLYQIKSEHKTANSVRNKLVDVRYQTVVFEGELGKVFRMLNFKTAKTTNIADGVLYSGYSERIKETPLNSGVNVQVFVRGSTIYIGSPTIYGSY